LRDGQLGSENSRNSHLQDGPKRLPDRQTASPPRFGWTISGNGLLCQPELGFQAELDNGSSLGEGFLRQLAVGGVKSNLFLWGISIRRGMGLS